MSGRLCSTLNPEGDLYATEEQARAAMGRMVKELIAEGYRMVPTNLAEPFADRAVMSHPNGQSVSIYLRL